MSDRTSQPPRVPRLSPSGEEILEKARRGIIDDRDDADFALLREVTEEPVGQQQPPETPAR